MQTVLTLKAQGNPSRDALEKKKPLNTVKSKPPRRVTLTSSFQTPNREPEDSTRTIKVYLVDEEYFVTAFVPSDTACLASSPGRISLTLMKLLVNDAEMKELMITYEVWISRDEMVDFLL